MTIGNKLNSLIEYYNELVKNIDEKALSSNNRAYGGIIRAGKGKLVENIAKGLVDIAWIDILDQNPSRLIINKKKIPIKIKKDYLSRIENPDVKNHVQANIINFKYDFGTDLHVYINKKLVMPIECKSYTENAMMKRIIFDAILLKEAVGTDIYYLLQLESQLGGDYSKLNNITLGSATTHVLLSRCDVDLRIITLLKGERKVDQPIHIKEHFKELSFKQLENTANLFAKDLRGYI